MGKPIIVRKRSSAPQLTEAEARRLRERVANLAIGFVPTAEVVANPRNAKRHPRRQVELIAENMRTYGPTHPALIDENNKLIGGHARVAAAGLLNLKQVPVIRLCNLSVAQQKRALALAENKLGELGSWNTEL